MGVVGGHRAACVDADALAPQKPTFEGSTHLTPAFMILATHAAAQNSPARADGQMPSISDSDSDVTMVTELLMDLLIKGGSLTRVSCSECVGSPRG